MRLKTSLLKEPKHTDLVSCCGWTTADELYSGGDDHKILRWSLTNNETTKAVTLPNDFYPLDMHWFPKGSTGGNKKGSDLFVLTSTDGMYQLFIVDVSFSSSWFLSRSSHSCLRISPFLTFFWCYLLSEDCI
jgi:hypothetical protein